MNTVAIVSVGDLRHISMICMYTSFFEENGITYDIICMNRYSSSLSHTYRARNIYQYNAVIPLNSTKLRKLIPYIGFRRYVIKKMKTEGYDFIIIWNENTAALLFGCFGKKYSPAFCINIRDPIEDMSVLGSVVLKQMKKAVFCTVPTPILKYEGISNLFVMLNQDKSLKNSITMTNRFRKNAKIRIVYLGIVYASPENFIKTIEAFKNDERFELCFFGSGAKDVLLEYLVNQKIQNVYIEDEFPQSKTLGYLENTDILNTFYGLHNRSIPIAIGVKQSYGPLLRIPELVDPNCLWAEISKHCGFGFVVDSFNSLADRVYDWYVNLEYKKFDEGCNDYCEYVAKTNRIFTNICQNVFINNFVSPQTISNCSYPSNMSDKVFEIEKIINSYKTN